MTLGGQCLGKPDHLQHFVYLNTVGILGQIILIVQGCSVYCKTFHNIPGMCPMDVSTITPLCCDNQKSICMVSNVTLGAAMLLGENH